MVVFSGRKVLDRIVPSNKEASFLDENLYPKNKIQIFFWMPCFGRVMLSARLVWARGQVLDQVFIEDSIAEELRKNGLEQLNKEVTK